MTDGGRIRIIVARFSATIYIVKKFNLIIKGMNLAADTPEMHELTWLRVLVPLTLDM